jgi:hypothetical protein
MYRLMRTNGSMRVEVIKFLRRYMHKIDFITLVSLRVIGFFTGNFTNIHSDGELFLPCH